MIVVSGENVCVFYYDENSVVMKEGDLLLIDVGVEFVYYVGDIICIFFVNGKFSEL